MASTGVKLY